MEKDHTLPGLCAPAAGTEPESGTKCSQGGAVPEISGWCPKGASAFAVGLRIARIEFQSATNRPISFPNPANAWLEGYGHHHVGLRHTCPRGDKAWVKFDCLFHHFNRGLGVPEIHPRKSLGGPQESLEPHPTLCQPSPRPLPLRR